MTWINICFWATELDIDLSYSISIPARYQDLGESMGRARVTMFLANLSSLVREFGTF